MEAQITVQPAEVKLDMPDRLTTSTIERDRNGNIIKTTQIETSIEAE